MSTTNYLSFANEVGTIVFSILIKPNTTKIWKGTCCLTFSDFDSGKTLKGGMWDSESYLSVLFSRLKKGKKHKDLKNFCQENSLDEARVREELVEIYQEIKRWGIWKK